MPYEFSHLKLISKGNKSGPSMLVISAKLAKKLVAKAKTKVSQAKYEQQVGDDLHGLCLFEQAYYSQACPISFASSSTLSRQKIACKGPLYRKSVSGAPFERAHQKSPHLVGISTRQA